MLNSPVQLFPRLSCTSNRSIYLPLTNSHGLTWVFRGGFLYLEIRRVLTNILLTLCVVIKSVCQSSPMLLRRC